MISIDEFRGVELKVGRVVSAERVEGSEKLVKLSVDLGEGSPRQILAGVGKVYAPEAIVGKQIVVVANLEPRKLMGMESNGMLLAAEGENGPVLLVPEGGAAPGSAVR